MTKELEQKIYRMLKSTDREMVFLGIHLLLNSATPHECMKMIPWNSMRHGIEVRYKNSTRDGTFYHGYDFEEIGHQWTRNSFKLNVLEYFEEGSSEFYTIWIKGNIAITYLAGSLICRRLGLMKCLHDFEKRPKVIYDAR